MEQFYHTQRLRSRKPLKVYYLIEVHQGSFAHRLTQDFLNSTQFLYRSVSAENHIEALNDLMDQKEFGKDL